MSQRSPWKPIFPKRLKYGNQIRPGGVVGTFPPTACVPTAITVIGSTRRLPMNGLRHVRVDATNNLAYLLGLEGLPGTPGTIATYDISDPTDMTLVSTFAPFGSVVVNLIARSGDVLFGASAGATSVYAVDYSDPLAPVLLDTLTNAAFSVVEFFECNADFLYLCKTSNLYIIDATDPTNLTLVNTITDTTNLNVARSITFSGTSAFVIRQPTSNTSQRFVSTIDITTPASASIVGGLNLANLSGTSAPYPCCVVGSNLYVGRQTVLSIDVSTPASPTFAGNATGTPFSNPRGMLPSPTGGVVAFADSSSRVQTFGLSNPAVPNLLDTETFTLLTDIPGGIDGDFLFVGRNSNPFGTFNSVDLNPDTAIAITQTVQDYVGDAPVFAAADATYMFEAGGSSNAGGNSAMVVAYNITAPSTYPVPIVGYVEDSNLNAVSGMVRNNNHLYVLSGGSKLNAVDITTPATPSISATLTDTTNLQANRLRALAMGTGVLFVTGGDSTGAGASTGYLSAFDVSTPGTPSFIDRITDTLFVLASGKFNALAVDGTVAYVLANTKLTSVDVSDPNNMVVLDDVTDGLLVDPLALIVDGDHAYGVMDLGDVISFNISNPAAMTVADTLSLGSGMTRSGVAITDDALYVAANDRVYTVDITDPTNLVAGLNQTVGVSNIGLAKRGNILYLPSSGSGNRVVIAQVTCA